MSRRSSGRADAVVGAGYGDEGKGLLVDALAHGRGAGTVVVRHNGGAQAGHTVTAPDGRRHVFHHVGSGSLAGAATHLSRHFVSNPAILAREIDALAALGVAPRITADERGLVTTPWDMMVNQFVEEARGGARHGSCGLGFGETIERGLDSAYVTTLADLRGDVATLRDRFDRIRREWVPRRLTRLGHPGLWLRHRDLILSPAGLERALADAVGFLAHADLVAGIGDAIPDGAPIVFEGSQGLGLDQHRGAFPHVTRSNTGLANVRALARELGLGRLDVTYVTRAYVTRHGAGPLPHEQAGPPTERFDDATNRANPWQGTLRFGRLDLDALAAAIGADLADGGEDGLDVVPRLAVTCLDQFEGGPLRWVVGGRVHEGSAAALATAVARATATAPPVLSYGPTRATLRFPAALSAS